MMTGSNPQRRTASKKRMDAEFCCTRAMLLLTFRTTQATWEMPESGRLNILLQICGEVFLPIIGEIRSFAFGPGVTQFNIIISEGWLPCDGRELTEESYIELEAALNGGMNWGAAVPNLTFSLPDLRGSFLRGLSMPDWSGERAPRDPNRNERVTPRQDLSDVGVSGASGNSVGSFQSHEYHSHSHTAYGNGVDGAAVGNGQALTRVVGSQPDQSIGMTNEGGDETRPINHHVLFAIYTGQAPSAELRQIIAEEYNI